jgi:hypothetical protein
MIRVVVGFILGCAVTAAVFLVAIVPTVRDNWRAQGKTEGTVSALATVAVGLRQAAWKTAGCADTRELFRLKTTSVWLVDCQGTTQINVQD